MTSEMTPRLTGQAWPRRQARAPLTKPACGAAALARRDALRALGPSPPFRRPRPECRIAGLAARPGLRVLADPQRGRPAPADAAPRRARDAARPPPRRAPRPVVPQLHLRRPADARRLRAERAAAARARGPPRRDDRAARRLRPARPPHRLRCRLLRPRHRPRCSRTGSRSSRSASPSRARKSP